VRDDIVAIVPVKALADAKSRLAPRLSPDERASLALRLFARVLEAVTGTAGIDRLVVVSSDEAVRRQARLGGAEVIDEPRAFDSVPGYPNPEQHNAALEYARTVAIERWDPAALLVVAADLPFLSSADLTGLIERGTTEGTVVLGVDRDGTGTNALLLRPANALPFRFGPDSLAAHRAEALQRGLRFLVHDVRGIATDVDVPRDLEVLAR
jgi:2-phospho-L-lactate guanylyltransferase